MKGLLGDTWVKNVGIYLVLILAVLRLIVYPLHISLKDKRAAYNDLQQTHATKTRLLERLHSVKNDDANRDQKKARQALYESNTRITEVQAVMLTDLSEMAVKRGLTVSGFETPEAVAGKKISEVTVVLKLKGNASSLIEMLRAIPQHKKAFVIKAMEITTTSENMNFTLTVSAYRMEV